MLAISRGTMRILNTISDEEYLQSNNLIPSVDYNIPSAMVAVAGVMLSNYIFLLLSLRNIIAVKASACAPLPPHKYPIKQINAYHGLDYLEKIHPRFRALQTTPKIELM